MKSIALTLLFLLATMIVLSQDTKSTTLRFCPIWQRKPFKLDSLYKLENGDSILFSDIRFYVSGITLLNNRKQVFTDKDGYYLIDASEVGSMSVELKCPFNTPFNLISFNIGIDSLTNAQGAMGGSLDPTNGMYWTWQNGYINIKLEGKSLFCKGKNKEFRFHLGGYQKEYNSLQKVELPINRKNGHNIFFDVKQWITKVDLSTNNHVMSPSLEAVSLSKRFSESFFITPK